MGKKEVHLFSSPSYCLHFCLGEPRKGESDFGTLDQLGRKGELFPVEGRITPLVSKTIQLELLDSSVVYVGSSIPHCASLTRAGLDDL